MLITKEILNQLNPDNAIFIVQEGFGHSAIANPTNCLLKNIKMYLLFGKLIKHGVEITCPAESKGIFNSQ
jgi:hypothetical protein